MFPRNVATPRPRPSTAAPAVRRAPLLFLAALAGARAVAAQGTLDGFVADALRASRTQRQEQLAVARADAQVSEARGRFLPSATVNARYSDVSGHVVDIGSLINPAFGALNQLMHANNFPTNLDLRLPLRQETTVRLAQPLFQPAVVAAYQISTNLRDAQNAERGAATRQLAHDLRVAYLTSRKAKQAVAIYAASMPLADEAVRLADRLVQNGKATPDALFRARAARSELAQRQSDAQRQLVDATEYVNLLAERPLDAPLPEFDDAALGIDSLPALEDALAHARAAREERQQLASATGAARAQRRLALSSFLPAISVALDYGFQGNEYRFARDADFTTTSVVLSWNLFNGAQDAARAHQAGYEAERLASQASVVDRQIELQVRAAHQAAVVARAAIATADDRVVAARRSWELVRRRYEEGMVPQVDLLDVRAALTAAELNRLITAYDYFTRRVELDRAAALYPRTLP
ncbi:MAG: TolC family protein [Gemmatimonadetes bacterium]|nr:TolC family protein [Gemmatimonadota bacterium]